MDKTMSMNISGRILVVDKSPIISYAINKLFTNYPHINIVGQCSDKYSILAYLKKCAPTIVVIDPDFPYADGLHMIKQIQRCKPDVQVIVYTLEHSTINFDEFAHLNIRGVVFKNYDVNNLLYAIQAIIQGFSWLDKSFNTPYAPRTTSMDESRVCRNSSSQLPLPELTFREKQVLDLISQGVKNKDIAQKLSLSVKTIESHRYNMMKKLDAHNVAGLIKWATRLSII